MGGFISKPPHRLRMPLNTDVRKEVCAGRVMVCLAVIHVCVRVRQKETEEKIYKCTCERQKIELGKERERGRALMYLCGSQRENQAAWYTHSFQCISFFPRSNPQVDHHKQILSLTSMS